MENKKILILGGGGFIGSSICRFLLENRNYNVTVADNFARGNKLLDEFSKGGNLKIINCDLCKSESFDEFDNNYDIVFFLAAVVGVDKVNKVPHEVISINSRITLNVLEWLAESNCKRVLFSSTSENYAGTVEKFNYQVPTDEKVPLSIEDITHPRFSYAVTKILGESGVINYARAGLFESVVVRYHNVYGPNMGFRHVIPHLIERFRKNENPFKIYGHDQTRAFNYIEDAVLGTVLAAEKGENMQIYHIGSEEEITIEELTKFIGDYYEFRGQYEFSETFPGSVSRRCPDITKAKKSLDYAPVTSWRDGVLKTVKWYEEYLDKNSNNESFYDQYGVKK